MASHSRLGLSIPERTPGQDNQLFLNLKEFEAWLSSLPMANIGETSRQVFKAVVEMNRREIPYLKRAQTVELLRQPIAYICKNLKKYYYDLPFPLSARNQKVAVLSRELHSELATSYKIIIEEQLNDPGGRPDKRLLAIALHQAVFYLSRVLYHSAIVYNPYPGLTWKEIHLLYRFATQLKLTDIPVKEGPENESATSTLLDLYRQTMLFGIASPYNLRQREIEYLTSNLPGWARHIDISACKQQEQKERASGFLIRTAEDEPPVHAALVTTPITGGCLQIDTQSLENHLRELLKQVILKPDAGGMQTGDTIITQSLLQKFIKTLSTIPKRNFVRTSLNLELEIAIGLAAIHSLIIENLAAKADDNDAEDIQEEGSQVTEEITLSLSPLGPAFDETGYAPNTASGSWLQNHSAPTWTQEPQDKSYTTASCKTYNESAGGYCIDLSGTDIQGIRVGEVVGIQSSTRRAHFSVGVARWIKNIPALGLQVGIEMISLNAGAVFVRPLEQTDNTEANQAALLLPEQKISNQPSSLIVQPFSHRVNDVVWVTANNDQKQARLTHLLEATGAFARFRFQYLDTIIRPEPLKNKAKPTREFDNIWEKL